MPAVESEGQPARSVSSSRRSSFSALSKEGFTLVELLIVVAIVGILAAIAITQFSEYRKQSYCARIKSDLANLAISQEAYYYDHDTYLVVARNGDGSSNFPEFFWSDGVTLDASAGNTNGWSATADHTNCDDGPFTWDSQAGGLQP
ncbi:MAG: type IV pilin protein [Candidatus Nitrospinota bacterium M3_3B_026]